MYYVYVLRSELYKSYYVGISQDPYKRLKGHNVGMSKYTKGRRPFKLVYIEACGNRYLAREKEKYYKSGIGREYLFKNLFPCSSVGRASGC